MLKKLLQIASVALLLAVPLSSRADNDTLVVANGTETNEYVPIYGYWADAPQHQQIIYPASMLTDMVGQNIVGMAFEITGGWATSSATVSMAIVPDSTLTAFVTPSTPMTVVYSGAWTSTTSMDFLNAFEYTGGHLLVDIVTVAGTYGESSATGISRSGASIYSYNDNSPSVQSFLPKVAFVYTSDAFCSAPSGVTATGVTSSSMTIGWTSAGEETAWEIKVNDSIIENVYTNPYVIENLASGTAYNVSVRALCDVDNNSAWSQSIVVRTECDNVTTLPWHDSFAQDAPDSYPMCWTILDTLQYEIEDWWTGDMIPYRYPTVYSSYYGEKYLYYAYDSEEMTSETSFIVSPFFVVDDLSALHFTFEAYGSNLSATNKAEIGVISDTSDLSTFVPMVTLNSEGSYDWTTYEFYTDTISALADADSVCFAVRFQSATYSYFYLRNVGVTAASTCRKPALNSGIIDSVSYDAVRLAWAPEEVDSYLVRLTDAAGTVTFYPATDSTLLITTLTANTNYNAEVASICAEDTTDYTTIGSFTTLLRCYPLSSASVTAVTATAASLTWSYTENMGIEHAGVYIEVTDQDSASATPIAVVATGTSHTFTGLVTNHRYQAAFRTLCGAEEAYDTASVITVSFMPEVPPCAELVGATTSSNVPFTGNYNYGHSQSLYANGLVAGVDTLTGIAFNNTTLPSNYYTRTVDIYLGYTALSTLSATDFVPVDSLTLVAQDAEIDVSTTGWHTIMFDTAFATRSTGNLVVTVVNKTGNWNNFSWSAVANTGFNSIYAYRDSAPYDLVADRGSVYTSNYVPAVRFQGNCGGDCVAPSASVSSVDTNAIVLEWLAGGEETSWTVQYRVYGDTTWTAITGVNASPYTITGLAASTSYEVRMGSECGDTTAFGSALTASTACGVFHAPFSAVFSTANQNCWVVTNTYVNSNYQAVNLYSNYYVVTPQLADSINTLQVRINARSYSDAPTSTQSVMVGACNADLSNIVWIDTINLTNVFADYVSYLRGYEGNLDRIIVRHAGNSDIYVHSISIEPLAACLPVTAVVLDSVTANSVALSWASDAEDFVLIYKSLDDSAATWQSVSTSDTTYLVTGLTDGTHYTFGVAVVCGDGTSDTVFVSTNTDCLPAALPYNQTLGFIPICWSTTTTGSIGTSWATSANAGYSYLYSSSNNPAANDWIITAPVAIPADAATNNVHLVYGTGANRGTYASSQAILEVYASTTGNSVADFTDTLIIDTLNDNNATLVYHRIPLGEFAGQTVRFAFRNVSCGYSTVFLVEVGVRSINTPLYYVYGPNPAYTGDTTEFVAERQEGDTNGMTLTWYSRMAAAGQATILNNGTDTMHIVYSAGGTDSISFIATNTHGADTIRGLIEVLQCDAITAFPWTVDFEDSTAIDCWRQEGNAQWTIGTGDNSTSTGSHDGSGNVLITHTDRGNVTKLITPVLNLSGSATATLTFWHLQRSWAGDIDNLNIYYRTSPSAEWDTLVSYTAAIESWTLDTITLPNTTATYQVAFEMVDNYGYGVALDDITISGAAAPACDAPVNVVASADETTATVNFISEVGNYEVAIAEQWDEATVTPVAITDTFYTFTGLTAATQYTIGVRTVCSATNMSDWVTVTVTTDEHPCATPSALTVTDVTLTSATLGWTIGEAETQWQLHVTGTNYDETFTVTTNPYTVTGLTPAVTYSFTVSAICSETQTSDPSEAQTFTTESCQPVSGVNVSNITTTTATVTWTAPAGVTSFEVEYGASGFNQGAGTTVQASTNSASLTGLTSNMAYDVYVRSVCAEGIYSAWSSVNTFTTDEQGEGIDDVNSAAIALYPNPATTTVTISGIEGQAMVTIVDMNGRVSGEWKVENDEITIDLTGYAQGAYFVRITGEKQNAIRKLIVK